MSIIFQKLKSLKSSSSEQAGLQRSRLAQGNNIYTFRRMIFSPIGVMLVFGTIAGFGLASYASLSFLIDYLNSGSNQAIVVQHQQPDVSPASFPGMDTPLAPPGLPPGSNPALTTGSARAKPGPAKKEKDFKVPEYFIYQTKKKVDNAVLDIPGAPDMGIPVDHLKPGKNTSQQDFFYTPSKKDQLQPTASVTENKTTEHEPPSKTVRTSDSEKTKFLEKEKEMQQEGIRIAKHKKIHKVSVIASLASDLEDAIEQDDVARTDQLLEQLALLKGANSSYLLKLKAFKEIREGNYDLAIKFLNKVLARDKTDFEAGINMAVIEIRKQEFKNARQRLIRLRELYPSKSTIDDLLNML